MAVIGGGQAGLALGWHLAKQRARFEILDAGPEIGHTWRSRWDSLRLFTTPAQYDALPGMPFPAPVDTYPGKDQVADYLQAYVSQFSGCRSGSTRGSPISGRPEPTSRSPGPTACCAPGWWLNRVRLMDKSTNTRLGRRIQSRGELVIGTNRRRLRRAGVAFRSRLVDADGTTGRFADGSSLDVGAIVWATGYRPEYSWIHVPGVLDRSGHVVHRRGVTDVPGLYFLGLSWQHTRGSALLGFVRDDADHVAHRIASQRRAILPRFTKTTSS